MRSDCVWISSGTFHSHQTHSYVAVLWISGRLIIAEDMKECYSYTPKGIIMKTYKYACVHFLIVVILMLTHRVTHSHTHTILHIQSRLHSFTIRYLHLVMFTQFHHQLSTFSHVHTTTQFHHQLSTFSHVTHAYAQLSTFNHIYIRLRTVIHIQSHLHTCTVIHTQTWLRMLTHSSCSHIITQAQTLTLLHSETLILPHAYNILTTSSIM